MGGRIVVMKEPVVVVPKCQSFSSHIYSRASLDVTVKVRVDRSVGRNTFTLNNPLCVERNDEHALC
jgi:hypothetical protein